MNWAHTFQRWEPSRSLPSNGLSPAATGWLQKLVRVGLEFRMGLGLKGFVCSDIQAIAQVLMRKGPVLGGLGVLRCQPGKLSKGVNLDMHAPRNLSSRIS